LLLLVLTIVVISTISSSGGGIAAAFGGGILLIPLSAPPSSLLYSMRMTMTTATTTTMWLRRASHEQCVWADGQRGELQMSERLKGRRRKRPRILIGRRRRRMILWLRNGVGFETNTCRVYAALLSLHCHGRFLSFGGGGDL